MTIANLPCTPSRQPITEPQVASVHSTDQGNNVRLGRMDTLLKKLKHSYIHEGHHRASSAYTMIDAVAGTIESDSLTGKPRLIRANTTGHASDPFILNQNMKKTADKHIDRISLDAFEQKISKIISDLAFERKWLIEGDGNSLDLFADPYEPVDALRYNLDSVPVLDKQTSELLATNFKSLDKFLIDGIKINNPIITIRVDKQTKLGILDLSPFNLSVVINDESFATLKTISKKLEGSHSVSEHLLNQIQSTVAEWEASKHTNNPITSSLLVIKIENQPHALQESLRKAFGIEPADIESETGFFNKHRQSILIDDTKGHTLKGENFDLSHTPFRLAVDHWQNASLHENALAACKNPENFMASPPGFKQE